MQWMFLLVFFSPGLVYSDGEEEEASGEIQDDILNIMGENATSLLNNTYYESSQPPVPFNFLETYLPLLIFVLDLPTKDREELYEFLKQKTYEKLKYNIDSKVRMSKKDSILGRLNETVVGVIASVDQFDQTTVDLVQGYHNASVYNAIRSVWLKQLHPFLPLIDQMAIHQYFAQKKSGELERMSFWARIWENLSVWMYGKKTSNECHAEEPKCVRKALESLSFEQRIDLDSAAYENRFDNVDGIIREKLDENQKTEELDNWLQRNRLPKAMESILDERSDVEEVALKRLRDNGVVSSLKHYYKAIIETRTQEEQEEIREFFDAMNETFAKCFDPLRGQYHDF